MPTPSPLARTVALLAVGLMASLSLSGCSDAKAEAVKAATLALAADHTTPVEPLWSIDAELVGTPAVTEEVVVSYIRIHGGMQIGAWDAGSGAELWRHAAVPGAQTHGVEVSATTVTVGDALFVPYLRDDPSSYYGWQKLVIADALTGEPLPHDWGLIWAANRPGACSGAEGICFTGWIDAESDADQRSFRIDVETGALSVDTEEMPPAAGRILGDGIFATDDRAPDGTEMLGYSADGAIAWQKPYQDYFGPNSSSDAGWAWGYGSSSDIVIGQGRQSDPEHEGAAAFTRDLTAFTTVGVRRDSGEMVWTLDGVYPACTAAGLTYAVVESDADGGKNDNGEAEVDSIVPMCRINSGSITFREADGPDQAPPIDNLDIDLIGVDGETGEIRWTVPLGAEEGSLFARESAFFSRTPSRVLMVGTVATVVDLATGESEPAPKDGIFSCAANRVGLNPNFFESVGRAMADCPFDAGEDVFPCNAHSRASKASMFSLGSVRDAGIHAADGIYVIGGAKGLSAFQLEDPEVDADAEES